MPQNSFSLNIIPHTNEYHISSNSGITGESSHFHVVPKQELEQIVEAWRRLYTATNKISDAQRIGETLFSSLFGSDIGVQFDRFLTIISSSQINGCELLLKYPPDPLLHELPFELLFYGETFLALSSNIQPVRYLEQPRPVKAAKIDLPIRILLTTASPQSRPTLDVSSEENQIREALNTYGSAIDLVVERNVSFDSLQHRLGRAAFSDRPFHIWHHSGHGYFDNDVTEDLYGLIFSQSDNEEIISIHRLNLVSEVLSLHLAVINVCQSGAPLGLSTTLAALNVPAAIGMRTNISDKAAIGFSKALYKSIFDMPLSSAMKKVRIFLATDTVDSVNSLDWSLPILHLRSEGSGSLQILKSVMNKHDPNRSTEETGKQKVIIKIGTITDSPIVRIIGVKGTSSREDPTDVTLDIGTIERIDNLDVTGDSSE